MKVKVKLYGHIRNLNPNDIKKVDGYFHMEFEKHETVEKVISIFEIPMKDKPIVLVNGNHAKLEDSLEDNSEICIFSPIAGG